MNIFKSKKTAEEEKRISAFEDEIRNAFDLMKKNGAERIVLAGKILSETDVVEAKRKQPELFGWTDTRNKMYYPKEAYSLMDSGVVADKKSYSVLAIISGNLNMERITSPWHTKEVKCDRKEGFEFASRYFIKNMDINVNPNQSYVTVFRRSDDENEDSINEYAKMLARNSKITPEDLRSGVLAEIDWYNKRTVELCEKEGVHFSIDNLSKKSESYFKPYLAVGEMIKNSQK